MAPTPSPYLRLSQTLSFLLLCKILSFGANATDFIDAKQLPQWFQEAAMREAEQIEKSKLLIAELNIDAEVLGKYRLQDNSDGTWYYTVDIGIPAPVECYIFTTFDGPATSMYAIMENALGGVEALNQKTLVSKTNYASSTGVIGDAPYLALDTLYTLEGNGEVVSGILKIMAAKSEQSLKVCMHNEIGYRASFYQTFESFVLAFAQKSAEPAFFKAIFQVSINGIPMGYLQEEFSLDADGDVAIINDSSLIVPVDANSIARTDTVSRAWSKPDGSLINASDYSIENGVLKSQFTISLAEGAWQVDGQLQGKALNTSLEYKGELLSSYGSYTGLEQLRESDNTQSETHMWAPSADPTIALPIVLSQIENDEQANFEVDMGPMVLRFLADDKGIFRQGTIIQGPLNMNIELIYSKGEPSLP